MHGRSAFLPVTVLLLLLAPSPAQANVDLAVAPGVRIDGDAAGALAGFSSAVAGDVNGDGESDLILGTWAASNNGRNDSGSAYVLYGGQDFGPVDLQNLGSRGFRIDGAASGEAAGNSVAGAGDVNGDGLADVIVGAPNTGNHSRPSSGSAYVVYGQQTPDPADLDLASLGTRGFRIDGAANVDEAGTSVAGAGDVNGDGWADVLVGAKYAHNNARFESGSAYVVYGEATPDPADLDLAALGTRGFRIDGQASEDNAGYSVASAGDLNGDGKPDIVVGALLADNNARSASGSAYVVYGEQSADPADLDLASLGTRGFRIDGQGSGQAGTSVAAAGDVNADGKPDLIVGAPFVGNNSRGTSGSAYVVYGQQAADPTDIDLATLGARGFRIDGQVASSVAGLSVGGGDDVNGDGIADVIVGSPGANNNSRTDSGSASVVYGQATADPADVDLATLGAAGFRIDGQAAGDLAGYSVAINDMNGDGHADAIVGAINADNNSRTDSGSVYVVNDGAPDTIIDSGPPASTNDSTPSFTFHGSEASTFQCSVDQGLPAFGVCSGPGATHTPASPLVDGTYTFRVRATDASGNADLTPATQVFTVDTTPPQTTIDSGPPGSTNDATPTFTFHGSEASTFQCSVDQGPPTFGACSGPGATHTPASALVDGTYTFRVRATDTSGNADPTPATQVFTVDTTLPQTMPPQTTITKHPKRVLKLKGQKRKVTARFSFTSSEPGSTFECRVDKKPQSSCASPKAYKLKQGKHSFLVVATDQFGNTDPSPATFTIKVKRA